MCLSVWNLKYVYIVNTNPESISQSTNPWLKQPFWLTENIESRPATYSCVSHRMVQLSFFSCWSWSKIIWFGGLERSAFLIRIVGLVWSKNCQIFFEHIDSTLFMQTIWSNHIIQLCVFKFIHVNICLITTYDKFLSN